MITSYTLRLSSPLGGLPETALSLEDGELCRFSTTGPLSRGHLLPVVAGVLAAAGLAQSLLVQAGFAAWGHW